MFEKIHGSDYNAMRLDCSLEDVRVAKVSVVEEQGGAGFTRTLFTNQSGSNRPNKVENP